MNDKELDRMDDEDEITIERSRDEVILPDDEDDGRHSVEPEDTLADPYIPLDSD
jgi:hypothetical protein